MLHHRPVGKNHLYIRLNGATGAITYAISSETDICSLSEGGVLTPGSQTGDVIVTVKIAEENKYEALERNITVTVTGKSTAFLTVAQSNTIYGTPLYDPDVNGQPPAPVENTSILYQGTEWDGLPFGPTEEKPTKAGSYPVTVIYETKPTVYTGVADFVIYPQSLANAEVELDKEEFIYDGFRKTVNAAVKIKGGTLTKNVDYTVSGASATNVGTYTVTVTGRGNYTGTVTAVFTIKRPEFGEAAITLPTGLKRLETNAFAGDFADKDAEIVIDAKNCVYIGTGAFGGHEALMKIRISGDCVIDTDAFGENNTVYIFCAAQNESAKNYCSIHKNCRLVLEPANPASE